MLNRTLKNGKEMTSLTTSKVQWVAYAARRLTGQETADGGTRSRVRGARYCPNTDRADSVSDCHLLTLITGSGHQIKELHHINKYR